LTVGVLGLATGAWAEVIILKDGQKVQGEIVSQTKDKIKVQIKQFGVTRTRTLRRSQIKSILKEGEEEQQKPEPAPEEKAPAEQPAEAPAEETSDESGEEQPEDTDKPATGEPADDTDEAPSDDQEQLPIEIDLRMALKEPLIYDTYDDGEEETKPRGSGYFVLVPFRYEAGDEPYRISRLTIKFKPDEGRARVRGLIPLEEKQSGGARATKSRKPSKDRDQAEQAEESVELQLVDGSPLYDRMTVYEDEDRLMVKFQGGPKSSAESDKSSAPKSSRRMTGRSSRRTSGSRGRSRSRGSSQSRGSSRRRTRSSARRPTAKKRPDDDEDRRSSRKTPGYMRKRDEEKEAEEAGAEIEATQEGASEGTKPRKGGRQPKEGEPASGWAAVLVELPVDASSVTGHANPGEEVLIDLRLIHALGQDVGAAGRGRSGRRPKQSGGASKGKDEPEDELEALRTVAEFANHRTAALSRLAVARLVELHEGGGGAKRSRRASQEDTADERTELIEGALLDALTSRDEQTQGLAWDEILSAATDGLSQGTEALIADAERARAAKALLELIEAELEDAAKHPASSEEASKFGSKQGKGSRPDRQPAGNRPPPRSGAKPPKARDPKAKEIEPYKPVGLLESAAPAGAWHLLGALTCVEDERSAMGAVSLALKDGSRQAVTLLGRPNGAVGLSVVKALADAPNTPVKHQTVRMVISGLLGNEGDEANAELLSGLTKVAEAMAKTAHPLRAAAVDEPLMAVVPLLRDAPDEQSESINMLRHCVLDDVMEAPAMGQWLADMTDELVSENARAAIYGLIAERWTPNRLPGLTQPTDAGQDVAAEEKPAAGKKKRPPKGKSKRPVQGPSAESPAEPIGVIETFLVGGLKDAKVSEGHADIAAALLRAGRPELVLAHLKSANAGRCVEVIDAVRKKTNRAPPSLVPGQPSRFAPLRLAMGVVRHHNEPVVHASVAGVLGRLLGDATDADRWRLDLAFKRRVDWEVLARLWLSANPQSADAARKAITAILRLAEGERTAADAAKRGEVLKGKLSDYDRQRGARIPGKYHGVVLCDVLVPSYTLQFDPKSDPKDKERPATMVGLTWHRQVVGVEPGLFEIVVKKDRAIEVKLGDNVVGTGKAPTAKEDDGPAGKALGDDKQSAELRKRLAELRKRKGAKAKPKGQKDQEGPTSLFAIDLQKLIDAIGPLPVMDGKAPKPELPSSSEKTQAKRPAKGGAEPPSPGTCPMHHLAFGARQGSLRLGDGAAPVYDSTTVHVSDKGRIIRPKEPAPVIQEIQIFLEPAGGS